jgi:hypothetical protein
VQAFRSCIRNANSAIAFAAATRATHRCAARPNTFARRLPRYAARESSAITAVAEAGVARIHDKLVSIEQKRSMRSCRGRTCIGDYRGESSRSLLADELL